MPNKAMRLLIGAPPNPEPAIPPAQTISMGAKTLKGLGGHALGVTNGVTPVIASQVDDLGATVSLFSIDSHRKLVFSGTYGTAAPALTRSQFVVTVTVGSDVGVVTVNTPANAFHITSINSGTNADTGTNQLSRTLQSSANAPGDTIWCRDDMDYNPTAQGWWVVPSANAAVTAAMTGDMWTANSDDSLTINIPDSSWITIRSETPYQAKFRRLIMQGTNRTKLGLRFYQLNFERLYQGVAFGTDHVLKFGTGPGSTACSYFDVVDNTFSSNDSPPTTQLGNGQAISAIGITVNGRQYAVRQNRMGGHIHGVELEGTRRSTSTVAEPTRAALHRNTLARIIEDGFKITNADDIYIGFNVITDKGYASTGAHGDFIQITWASSGAPPLAGTYAFGRIVGNILARGVGTPGWSDGQGIFITVSSTVFFSSGRVEGNHVQNTMARGIQVAQDSNFKVRFNTIIRDETVGITQPSTPSTVVGLFRDGAGATTGDYSYNIIYSTTAVDTSNGADDPTMTGNLTNIKAAQYASTFADPSYGEDSDSVAEIIAAWSMKPGGLADKATTGQANHAGALGTGYVNWDTFTTAFPA